MWTFALICKLKLHLPRIFWCKFLIIKILLYFGYILYPNCTRNDAMITNTYHASHHRSEFIYYSLMKWRWKTSTMPYLTTYILPLKIQHINSYIGHEFHYIFRREPTTRLRCSSRIQKTPAAVANNCDFVIRYLEIFRDDFHHSKRQNIKIMWKLQHVIVCLRDPYPCVEFISWMLPRPIRI